jgi:hypothetical protein
MTQTFIQCLFRFGTVLGPPNPPSCGMRNNGYGGWSWISSTILGWTLYLQSGTQCRRFSQMGMQHHRRNVVGSRVSHGSHSIHKHHLLNYLLHLLADASSSDTNLPPTAKALTQGALDAGPSGQAAGPTGHPDGPLFLPPLVICNEYTAYRRSPKYLADIRTGSTIAARVEGKKPNPRSSRARCVSSTFLL